MSGLGLTFLRRGGQAHPSAGSDYIKFDDDAVFNILMNNGVSSDGVGITLDDAAAVTSIKTWFKGNTTITSFRELQYFTGITILGGGAGTGNSLSPFFNCTSLEYITIPKSVKTIGPRSFYGCTALKRVGSLEDVETIHEGAFYSAPIGEGEILSLPNLKGTIGNISFRGAKYVGIDNLGQATQIPSGVSYAEGAFAKMTYLKSVRIPSTMTLLGRNAFASCSALEIVICEAPTPPTGHSEMFLSTNSTFIIYVPDASVEAYKTATKWSVYADRIKPLSEYQV